MVWIFPGGEDTLKIVLYFTHTLHTDVEVQLPLYILDHINVGPSPITLKLSILHTRPSYVVTHRHEA